MNAPVRPSPGVAGLLANLAVTWEQGGASVEPGTVGAGQDGNLSVIVTIPAGATSGKATISVGDIAQPVTVTVSAP